MRQMSRFNRPRVNTMLRGRQNYVPFVRQIADGTIDLFSHAKAANSTNPALLNSALLMLDAVTAKNIPDFKELSPVFQRFKITEITVRLYPIFNEVQSLRDINPAVPIGPQTNQNLIQTRINTKYWLDQQAPPQYGDDVITTVNQMPKTSTTVYGGKRPLVLKTVNPRQFMEITENEGPGYALDTSVTPPVLNRNTKTVTTHGRWIGTDDLDTKWIHNDAILFRPVDEAYSWIAGQFMFRAIVEVKFLCTGYH